MDEVDAALDNVNVKKVCNYIKQRSHEFQCIVISLKVRAISAEEISRIRLVLTWVTARSLDPRCQCCCRRPSIAAPLPGCTRNKRSQIPAALGYLLRAG